MVEALESGRLVTTAPEAHEVLSEREIEVLKLAARGLTNVAIAQALNISDRTVHGHLSNIYAELQASSRTEAVLKALRQGYIGLDDVTE